MTDENTPQANEDEEQTGDSGDEASPEEIENDPAHEPDEEGLKDLKGG
jgi:hypothetical protein